MCASQCHARRQSKGADSFGSRLERKIFLPRRRRQCMRGKSFFFCFLVEIWEWRKDPGKKMEEKKSFWDLNSTVSSIKQILGILHDESFFFLLSQLKWVQELLFLCLFFISSRLENREKTTV